LGWRGAEKLPAARRGSGWGDLVGGRHAVTGSAGSLAGFVVPADFGRFRQHIDPTWIEEALDATETASVRRRRLPAEQAIWLVIGMALLRQESIERVVMMLGLALPAARGDTAAKSGIAQARKRLGEEPLAYNRKAPTGKGRK